jgi:flavin reductase (DIM6/NTAB) family NADH-FMN oxidoreductase RutF
VTLPSSLDLGDEEFFTAFERDQFEGHAFPHRAHLRLAWLCVRHFGVHRAVERVTAGIRAIAEKGGRPALYHDTLTRAWVYAVAAADGEHGEIATFDAFLEAHPELLDKNYLLRFYSAERLSSPEARARWLAPDLRPIPGAPPTDAAPGKPGTTLPALPAEEFRRAFARVPLAVAVMTARDATRVHGTTVSAVAAAERDPAMLIACVRRDSRILEIARAAGGFAISYLGADQSSIAARFADRARGEDVLQFGGIPHVLGPFGAPIVSGGPAWFECRLQDELAAADHQVVCGTVVAAGTSDRRPLQRLQGGWV